jgi:cytochrome b561
MTSKPGGRRGAADVEFPTVIWGPRSLQTKGQIMNAKPTISPTDAQDTRVLHAKRYSGIARSLHWLMAAGFLLMWLTGVLVTNVEGVPFFTEDDRQGMIRDLHKSIGLTLLGLLILRAGLRFVYPAPALPDTISPIEQRRAHLGHVAIYGTIIVACITGLAIADVHEYGNSYFGIPLPQLFPTTESIAGWASTPWVYVLHAIVAYGLLALILGHVAFVVVHRRKHKVQLLTRMLKLQPEKADRLLARLAWAATGLAAVIVGFAMLAFMTLGSTEEPRDYITTTPFFGP